MDVIIIVSSILQFFIFLFFHILTIRTVGDKAVFMWLLRIFITVGIVGAIIGSFVGGGFPTMTLAFVLIVTFICYGILTFTYIMAIFGISLTSLRIQLLAEIITSDNERIKLETLTQKYNRKKLIRQRLFRLTSSGVISERSGKYYLKQKLSPYFIHIRIADFLYRLYK